MEINVDQLFKNTEDNSEKISLDTIELSDTESNNENISGEYKRKNYNDMYILIYDSCRINKYYDKVLSTINISGSTLIDINSPTIASFLENYNQIPAIRFSDLHLLDHISKDLVFCVDKISDELDIIELINEIKNDDSNVLIITYSVDIYSKQYRSIKSNGYDIIYDIQTKNTEVNLPWETNNLKETE